MPGRASRRGAGALITLLVAGGLTAASAGGTATPPLAGVASTPSPPPLSARAAILEEPSTGQVLYARAANQPRAIASTTKLMTAYVVLHRAGLDRVLTMPPYRELAAESTLGLATGERMRVRDLLRAMLLPSANDAADDLAHGIGGSIARFVGWMNADARRLGLRATRYQTPVGLDTPGNYSTAADLARLAAADLANPFFAATVSRARIRLQSGSHPRVVTNRNTLVGRVPWVDGVKTGHTIDAGYVLVGSGERNGMHLISVVLGTPSEGARDADTLALLRWGYAGFVLRTPLAAGAVAVQRAVAGGGTAPVIAARALSRVVPRGARARVALELPRELRGPIARHARVGTAVLVVSGRPAARVALLAGRAIKAPPSTPAVVTAGVTLAAAAALLGGLRLVIRGRRRERERRRSADVELA